MKRSFLFLLLLLNISLFAQSNRSWYKELKGTIGKYPVTLHIYKAGHEYSGYYFYDSKNEPMNFTGDDTTAKGKIRLIIENEEFMFSLAGGSAAGSWKETKKKTILPFSAKETSLPVNFTYVYTDGEVRLRPKWKESPGASYYAATIWPLGKTPTDEVVKKEIRDMLGYAQSPADIGALLLKSKKAFLKNYLDDNKEAGDEDVKEGLASLSLYEHSELKLKLCTSKIIGLGLYIESFTGGAHGNHGFYYRNIDLTSNKVLTLDDIITDDGKKALSGLLERDFRKQYDLKPTDSLTEMLDENKIEPNDNFSVTEKGIEFCYNPYEIAPYAVGDIHLTIPYSSLKNYLKDGFKKLIE